MSYSSKTALVVQHAIEFNLQVELKNIILVAFRYFEFLHNQGHSRRLDYLTATTALPPEQRTSATDPACRKKRDFRTIPRCPKMNLAQPAALAYRLPDINRRSQQ